MVAITPPRIDRAAIVLGLALAAVLVLGWRVEGGEQVPPAQLELVTSSSNALALSPAGVTSERRRLRASASEQGLERELTVRNPTGRPLAVTLRASAQLPGLERALALRVVAAGRTVFEGTLATLRGGTTPFRLAGREQTAIRIRAWIPESAPDSTWRARSATVALELDAAPVSR